MNSMENKIMNQEARITPAVLQWARERKYISQETAAAVAGISLTDYAAVEAGTKRMTIEQTRRLAEHFGRPLAFFYLPEPPNVKSDSPHKRTLRVRQDALIEVNAEFSDEDIKKMLIFGLYDEAADEVYNEGDGAGFVVVEYLTTEISETEKCSEGEIS